MNLPQFQHDKANHFIYGFAIFVIANIWLSAYASLAIVFLAGTAKELYDEYKYGGFDWKDLLATIIPAIILTLKSIL